MAQDGPHGHQDAIASGARSGAPPATVVYTLSLGLGGNNSGGSGSAGSPVGAGAGKGKDVVAMTAPGEERGRSSQSEGKRSSADGVAAADVANDGASKGKIPAAAAGGVATGAGGSDDSDSRVHILAERERRKRMKDMFTALQAFLPNVSEKTDKATMVANAISYIKVLEDTVAKLETRKQELAAARAKQAAAVASEAGGSSSSVQPQAAQAAAMASLVPHSGGSPLLQGQQQPAPVAAAPPPLSPVAAGPVGFQSWSGTNVVLSVANDDAYINVCVPRRPGVLTMVMSVLENHKIDVVTTQVSSDGARTMFNVHGRVRPGASEEPGEDPMTSEDIYKLAVSEIMIWLNS